MLVVASRLDPAETMNIDALRDELRAAGYVDGRNVVIDYRWAEGRLERLNSCTDELVGGKPDVIVAISEPAAMAARHATTTIPSSCLSVAIRSPPDLPRHSRDPAAT